MNRIAPLTRLSGRLVATAPVPSRAGKRRLPTHSCFCNTRQQLRGGQQVRLISYTKATQRHGNDAAATAGIFTQAGPVTTVADTDDLIDMLLTVGTAKPAWIFFDIDETLVTRDTCLVHGFQHTTYLLERLRTRLAETGSSGARASEVVRKIQAEMEREYYDSDIKLVDPLLARLVRGLKVQGHHVFGLTSNEPFSEHSITTVAALAQYKIRFSDPWIRGELPFTGAMVMDHVVVNGIIFADNSYRASDKGAIIAEFAELRMRWQEGAGLTSSQTSTSTAAPVSGGSSSGSSSSSSDSNVANSSSSEGSTPAAANAAAVPHKQLCVLVDNTETKCRRAAATFAARAPALSLALRTIHYTQAEAAIDAGLSAAQFRQIVERLREEGYIDEAIAHEFWDSGSSMI